MAVVKLLALAVLSATSGFGMYNMYKPFDPQALFPWHPTLMFASSLFAGLAVTLMRFSKMHRSHSLLNFLGLTSMLAGLYVIYTVSYCLCVFGGAPNGDIGIED